VAELYGVEILDAIAIHALANVSAIHKAYSALAGTQTAEGTLLPIPRGMDDSPVLVMTMGAIDVEPGNVETTHYDINGDIWVKAPEPGHALETITAIPDLIKIACRSDVDANGTATMAYFLGADEPVPETLNGTPWLRTRCHFKATGKHHGGYSITHT
jgi:hypothetical protein